MSSDQRWSFLSSWGRKMPTMTGPAVSWSNMEMTSSVSTSVPSARRITAGMRRPSSAGTCESTKSSKPPSSCPATELATMSSTERPISEPAGHPISCSAAALV